MKIASNFQTCSNLHVFPKVQRNFAGIVENPKRLSEVNAFCKTFIVFQISVAELDGNLPEISLGVWDRLGWFGIVGIVGIVSIPTLHTVDGSAACKLPSKKTW